MNLPGRLDQNFRRVWATLYLAVKKFWQIDGVQWAGAFAFNAFFSLFPLIVLFVTKRNLWDVRRYHGIAVVDLFSGCIFIFGACLSAAHAEGR